MNAVSIPLLFSTRNIDSGAKHVPKDTEPKAVINRKALRGKREKIDRRFLTLVAYSFSLADPGCLSCELHLAKIGAAIP